MSPSLVESSPNIQECDCYVTFGCWLQRTSARFSGESILLCKDAERTKALELVQSPLSPVSSCLRRSGEGANSSLRRAILEVSTGEHRYNEISS